MKYLNKENMQFADYDSSKTYLQNNVGWVNGADTDIVAKDDSGDLCVTDGVVEVEQVEVTLAFTVPELVDDDGNNITNFILQIELNGVTVSIETYADGGYHTYTLTCPVGSVIKNQPVGSVLHSATKISIIAVTGAITIDTPVNNFSGVATGTSTLYQYRFISIDIPITDPQIGYISVIGSDYIWIDGKRYWVTDNPTQTVEEQLEYTSTVTLFSDSKENNETAVIPSSLWGSKKLIPNVYGVPYRVISNGHADFKLLSDFSNIDKTATVTFGYNTADSGDREYFSKTLFYRVNFVAHTYYGKTYYLPTDIEKLVWVGSYLLNTSCVVGSTPILTTYGQKQIKDITYNDTLIAYDFKTGQITYKKPYFIHKDKAPENLLEITLSSGTKIKLLEHEFFDPYTQSVLQCSPDNLCIGRHLFDPITPDNIITIDKAEVVPNIDNEKIYGLYTDDSQTYITAGVLSMNLAQMYIPFKSNKYTVEFMEHYPDRPLNFLLFKLLTGAWRMNKDIYRKCMIGNLVKMALSKKLSKHLNLDKADNKWQKDLKKYMRGYWSHPVKKENP
jgi:hypothetical protein